MNLRNEQDIEKLNKRLEQVVKDEYSYDANEMYASIEKIEIDYIYSITTNLTIIFGRNCGIKNENNWQKEITIPLISDNLEFIAGQFTQAIIDKDL